MWQTISLFECAATHEEGDGSKKSNTGPLRIGELFENSIVEPKSIIASKTVSVAAFSEEWTSCALDVEDLEHREGRRVIPDMLGKNIV